MSVFFSRVIEFSIYGMFWISVLFLASLWIGKRTGVLWQYFVAACIAVHMLIPVHIQWMLLDIPTVSETYNYLAMVFSDEDKEGKKEAVGGTVLKPLKEMDNSVLSESKSVEQFQTGKKMETDSFASNEEWQTDKERLEDSSVEKIQWQKDVWVGFGKMLWYVGMIFYFCRLFLSYTAFCRMAKRWSLPVSQTVYQLLEKTKHQYRIRRKIELRRNSKVTSPMLYGVIRPIILLPDMNYSEEEYCYIFQHELCHYKHGDVLMKYVFTLCKGIYWFHPMVHWMCGRAFAQMEFLCDEAVVNGKKLEDKRAYSMVLLKHMLSERNDKNIPLTTSFYGGKEYMKMRFRSIMDTTKRKAGVAAIMVTTVVVILLGGVKCSNATDRPSGDVRQTEGERSEKSVDRKILVIGKDEAGYADALVLVDVDSADGKITIENVPRDLMVDFREVAKELAGKGVEVENLDKMGSGKLGASCVLYGYGLLVGAVERLYQVEIDSHLVISYAAVSKVVDAAGGVEVELTKKEAKYLNSTNYISQKKNRNVKAGKQRLNGDQAMGYMRIRKAEAGSPIVGGKKTELQGIFARSGRYNNVLFSLVKQVRGSKVSWSELLYSLIEGKLDTGIEADISPEELILLTKKIVSGEFDVKESGESKKTEYIAKWNNDVGGYLEMKRN